MVAQHYRWDFIGLSTDSKPTPATSEKVTDGSTFYCSDNSKLYVWYKNQWYEKEGGGGGELPIASADTLGGIKVGSGLSINSETGVLSADGGEPYVLPIASSETLGGIKVGSGLSINSETGALSVVGGGPTVVQTPGKSQDDVMSQKAVTSMVFSDPNTRYNVKIGESTSVGSNATASVVIGYGTSSGSSKGLAIGANSKVSSGENAIAIGGSLDGNTSPYALARNSIALGSGAYAYDQGQLDIGLSRDTGNGYNNTDYRLITGVHDGQSLHDAATVAQGNTLATSAPTTSTVGVLGQLYTDTTTLHTYQCTAISGSTYTWTQRW